MTFAIKEISENGIVTSADIIRRSFMTVAGEFGLTKESAPTNGAFMDDAELLREYRSGIKMFGLFSDETQIGFVALEQKDSEIFYLEKLAVLPEYRHKGCGESLVNHTVNYVKRFEGKCISIGIIHENKRLLKWYEKLGFKETEIKKFPHLPFTVCFMIRHV